MQQRKYFNQLKVIIRLIGSVESFASSRAFLQLASLLISAAPVSPCARAYPEVFFLVCTRLGRMGL